MPIVFLLLQILQNPNYTQLVEESPDLSHRNAEFWNERISVQLFKYYNDDKEVMQAAASKDPTIVKYASDNIKNNKLITLYNNKFYIIIDSLFWLMGVL